MILKKLTTLFSVLFFATLPLQALPADNVKEYTLENNMKIFLLEDTSDALVHIEFTCHAGFSSQTQNTNGFFKLFTRLVKGSNPELNFSTVECNADSSRYILEIAPQKLDQTLTQLSDAVFSPSFSDEVFQAELTKLKNEVNDNAGELSTYINAAIDSRVFSDAPWKHDSGIYPPVFKRISTSSARNIIKDISDRWYTPQNSALFICGNFNSEKLLVSLRSSFGRFFSNYRVPAEKDSIPVNSHRKYVFHHPEISNELTQIVIQYTMMEMEECDLLAASLNNDVSSFKSNLLELSQLNIPGAEYINISAAHKRNSSRLIIQALMQPPENKKNAITSFNQTSEFTEETKKIADKMNDLEFLYGKIQLQSELQEIAATPLYLMNSLSNFWALEPYYKSNESDGELYPESKLTSLLFSRIQKIKELESQEVFQKLKAEEPFIFVIISDKDFKKNRKAYLEAGFEEISEKNSSWYVQNLFKEVRDQFKPNEDKFYSVRSNQNDNAYFQRNLSQIETKVLENGIKIVSKKNPNSQGISLLLSVKGGKLNSADNNGFEEVIINLMASNIQRELTKKQYSGIITGNPQVSAQTGLSTSTILISFDQEDSKTVCDTIAQTIIYNEIPPASADRAVSSRQYKKRLENGNATNQLFSAAVNTIYGKGDFANIFDSEKDVLLNTDFNSILQAYPDFLDASRYNLIVTGNFDDKLLEYLSQAFKIFANNNIEIKETKDKENLPQNSKINVKIRHTFLTDIPAEEAGPQPAVLIPTTEFLDPVLYITKVPSEDSKKAAIFNAIMNQLQIELQNQIDKSRKFDKSTVSLVLPRSKMNFASIYILNVSHTKEADSIYRSAVQSLFKKMLAADADKTIIQDIKNNWISKQLNETFTNKGTAFLIHKGFELFPENPQPDFYLQEYNYILTASVQDFLEVMDLIPDRANLRVYSGDGRS